MNFFAEKHGKNGRDSHFSNLSRFIKAESLVRKLVSSQDIVEAIISRQELANLNNNGILLIEQINKLILVFNFKM